jgi:hypothetical protein
MTTLNSPADRSLDLTAEQAAIEASDRQLESLRA